MISRNLPWETKEVTSAVVIQVQERLTKEIAEAVWEAVAPAGVGVVVEASHMCMVSK
jgi:GTP cyclohydrolase I